MVRLITVKGVDTSRGPNPVAIHAPVDKSFKVRDAIIIAGEKEPFVLWQEVTWYIQVDPEASALIQRPGADLEGAMILVLMEI